MKQFFLLILIFALSVCSSKAEIIGYYSFQKSNNVVTISEEAVNEPRFKLIKTKPMEYPYIFEIYYQKIVEDNKGIDSKPYKVMDILFDKDNWVYFIKYKDLNGNIFFEDYLEDGIKRGIMYSGYSFSRFYIDADSNYFISALVNFLESNLSLNAPLIVHEKISENTSNNLLKKLKNAEKYELEMDMIIDEVIKSGETKDFYITPKKPEVFDDNIVY